MSRLRFNAISGTATSNPITIASSGATSCSWVSAPAFPTIVAPDYCALMVGTPPNEEIVWLTSYTAGTFATSGNTILRNPPGEVQPLGGAAAHSAVAWAHGPTAADFMLIPPPLAKLMVGGHSYADPTAGSFAELAYPFNSGASAPNRRFCDLVRDACGVESGIVRQSWASRSNAAVGDTVTVMMPARDDDSILVGASYTPTATVTGSATTGHTYSITDVTTPVASSGTQTFSGVLENVFLSYYKSDNSGGLVLKCGDILQYCQAGQALTFKSTAHGTPPDADFGGTVSLRFLARYWNVAVGGSQLLVSSSATQPTQGGWSTWAQFQPPSISIDPPNALMQQGQMKITSAVAVNGTTASVDQVPFVLGTGSQLICSGGVTLRLTAGQAVQGTSATLTFAAASGAVANKEVANHKPLILGGTAGATEPTFGFAQKTTARNGLIIMLWGTNDLGVSGAQEIGAFKEAARYVIAMGCCPWRQYTAGINNFTGASSFPQLDNAFVAASSGSATWAFSGAETSWCARPQHWRLSGSTSLGTSTATFTIPAWYDGVGAVDLFFASKVGANGGNATITYAQTNSPGSQPSPTALFTGANSGFGIKVNGGAVAGHDDVIDTGSFSTTVATASNNTAVPLNAATISVLGVGSWPGSGFDTNGGTCWINVAAAGYQSCTYTGVSGTTLTGVTSVDQSLTGTMVTGNAVDNAVTHAGSNSVGVGMVKRITGLPAGGGQLLVTVNAIQSSSAEFILDVAGVEAVNPSQPVLWLNHAYIPNALPSAINGNYAHGFAPNVVDLLATVSKAVIAERAEVPANVIYLDMNPLLGAIPARSTSADCTFTSGSPNFSGADLALTAADVGANISSSLGTTPTWAQIQSVTSATAGIMSTNFVGTTTTASVATISAHADPTYFSADGVHISDKGHLATAAGVLTMAAQSFTTSQLISR